jgi:WD40 repeat protein
MVFTHEGKRLTALMRKTLRSWDLETGQQLRYLRFPKPFDLGLLSPDGRFVVGRTGHRDLSVVGIKPMRRFWLAKTQERSWLWVTFPDSQWVAARVDDEIRFWHMATGQETGHVPDPPDLRSFIITPDKNLLIGQLPKDDATGYCIGRLVAATGVKLSAFESDEANLDSSALVVSPDGKTLVTADRGSGLLRLWEVASGKARGVLEGHEGSVVSLAFSADWRRLASGSCDTTALLWDLASAACGTRPMPERLTADDLDALWADLRSDDAAAAYRAVALLAAFPKESVPYLREHVAATHTGPKQIARLLAQLDDAAYATRRKAYAELADMAEVAEQALRAAAKDPPSAEVGHSVEDLLEKVKTSPYVPTGERLRAWRALEALEMCGTAEARDVLATLAQGDEAARLTREAKMAVERLRNRGVAGHEQTATSK